MIVTNRCVVLMRWPALLWACSCGLSCFTLLAALLDRWRKGGAGGVPPPTRLECFWFRMTDPFQCFKRLILLELSCFSHPVSMPPSAWVFLCCPFRTDDFCWGERNWGSSYLEESMCVFHCSGGGWLLAEMMWQTKILEASHYPSNYTFSGNTASVFRVIATLIFFLTFSVLGRIHAHRGESAETLFLKCLSSPCKKQVI